MALDVAMLGENGEPESTVPIRVNEHARLLSAVHGATLPLLSRLHDYYEDVEYEPQELVNLTAELDALRARVRGDDELAGLVSKLVDLVVLARRLGRQVVAFSD